MIYQTTLVLGNENKESVKEIEEYIKEKKGKILDSKFIGKRQVTREKKQNLEASIHRLTLELMPEEISKIKKKIGQEKEVISFILEKGQIIKPKIKEEKQAKSRSVSGRKETTQKAKRKESQASKVLNSMQEEEEKIKDLDSTLDELLNE